MEEREQPLVSSEDNGVKITDEVLAIIAGIAATEVSGVTGMSAGLAGGIAEALGRRSLSKGVKVILKEGGAVIDLYVIVEYGIRIPDIAWKIQEKVKSAVESMTDIKVSEVNIHIQGINIDKEIRKENTNESSL
ncbi:MAG: Asp23/Gls24 family envelope stress response protein [Clostridiales bacterium]|jgi:uncharacterized alkaline shock family protein YloU|nr:Asp23/Gls24 family envelope stress response protein [Clostridiales bacterium]